MFYILAHSIPLQKVYFFSDNFTFAYAIQGFVERYLANEIELINIVYFHTQADKQRYTANQVLSETVQNLNEIGLNNFDFIQPVVITGRCLNKCQLRKIARLLRFSIQQLAMKNLKKILFSQTDCIIISLIFIYPIMMCI